MTTDLNLEDYLKIIIGRILIPAKSFDLDGKEIEFDTLLNSEKMISYQKELTLIVFKEPRDYDGFRAFLRKYEKAYPSGTHELFDGLKNSHLDFILDNIMEIKNEYPDIFDEKVQ